MNLHYPSWNHFDTSIGPIWVPKLYELIAEINPPSLKDDSLYILSDYSGGHKNSNYLVTSILCANLDRSRMWEYQRREVRKKFLADGRRMSFKGLNDRQKRQALDPFLGASNQIHGLLVTIAIHKGLKDIIGGKEFLEGFREMSIIKGKWSPRSFEAMMRVSWIVSFLIAGFSRPQQNIYWISDEHSFFSNPTLTDDVAAITSRLTSFYVPYPLGELGIGTTILDEEDRELEDLAAIPDLACGCVAELTTSLEQQIRGSFINNFWYYIPPRLSSKSRLITPWLSNNSVPLRKTIVIMHKIVKAKEEGIRMFRMNLE